jgi:hypothetical protein
MSQFRIRLGTLLFLGAVITMVGCSKPSSAPVLPSPPVPTTAPAASTTGISAYHLAMTATVGRSENGGQLVFERLEPSTIVVVVQAGREWSRVRMPDGSEGWVPTVRLGPPVAFDEPGSPAIPLTTAPVFNFMAGAEMPAVPELAAASAPTAPDDSNSPDGFRIGVPSAINTAGKYLVSLRQNDNWETAAAPVPGDNGFSGARWGQLTALATYAQLLSGELPDVSGSVNWLANAHLATSAVASRDEVLPLLFGTKFELRDKSLMRRLAADDARILVPLMFPKGLAGGALATQDFNSSSRTLADLDKAGWEVLLQCWTAMEQGTSRLQNTDGSWGATGMSAADRAGATGSGVLARTLIREKLRSVQYGLDCRDPPFTDTCLLRAAAWLDAHAADAIGDPAAMWAVEQAALATGRKYFGAMDWYRAGAEFLLKTQNSDGSWPASPGADPAGRRIPETAYAMLFLSHGSCPLIINKLDYQSAPDPKTGVRHFGPAQQRPRDVAHFAAWAGKILETGRPLNWQWVNFSMPPADFQEAPVLYVAGSEALSFSPAQIAMLRNYALGGGLIVGNADCGSQMFITSFCNLGSRQLFPLYTFRPLPPDHPLLAGEMFKASKRRSPGHILGLSNGVRELMLIPDADMSRAWQLDALVLHRDDFQLGMDILMYASRLDDWADRGALRLVTPNPKIVPNRVLRVARLDAGNNPDPEPAGWERLAALMHNQFAIDLQSQVVAPTANALVGAIPPFQVACLTGTGAFTLSAQARMEIAAFVNAGGTLIVDAAGGDATFAASAEAELSAMFPGPPGQAVGTVLLPKDAVYTLKAAPIDHFAYRRFARAKIAGSLKLPRVQGITVGNRLAVFFSPEDLSNGLVGQQTDGVIGYDPETATAIMRNLLLYAAGER